MFCQLIVLFLLKLVVIKFYIILRLEKDEAYIVEHFSDLKDLYQNITFENKLKSRANTLSAIESEYVRSLSYEEIK